MVVLCFRLHSVSVRECVLRLHAVVRLHSVARWYMVLFFRLHSLSIAWLSSFYDCILFSIAFCSSLVHSSYRCVHMLTRIKAGNVNLVEFAWLAELASVSHRLLLELADAPGGPKRWYHLLTHYPDSACLAWPGELKTHGAPPIRYFEHAADLHEPCLIALCAVLEVRACTFVWRSPLWQLAHFGDTTFLPRRILAVIDEGPCSVLQVIARKACWNLCRSTVVKLASFLGMECAAGASLVSLLEQLVIFAQGCCWRRSRCL